MAINGGQTLTLSSGGLLVPNAGAATAINGGTLLGGLNADLIVIQNSLANAMTIGSVIADNTNGAATSGSALTKASQGTLILTGANTYTGPTYINGTIVSGGSGTGPGTIRCRHPADRQWRHRGQHRLVVRDLRQWHTGFQPDRYGDLWNSDQRRGWHTPGRIRNNDPYGQQHLLRTDHRRRRHAANRQRRRLGQL